MIEALENGPMRTRISDRLKVDLAGNGPHKLYLNELEDIRDGIIDNAIPTARARNRTLETIPTNIASSVIKLLESSVLTTRNPVKRLNEFKNMFKTWPSLMSVIFFRYIAYVRPWKISVI